MIIVTGFPIGYAVYLSLQKYDLRFRTRRSSWAIELRRRPHVEHLVERRLETRR